jgi:hypothetical protein
MKKWGVYILILLLFFQKDSLIRTLRNIQSVIQIYEQQKSTYADSFFLEISSQEWENNQREQKEFIWKNTIHDIVSIEKLPNGNLKLEMHADQWETHIHEWIKAIKEIPETDDPIIGIDQIKWCFEGPLNTHLNENAKVQLLNTEKENLPQHLYESPHLGIEVPPPVL